MTDYPYSLGVKHSYTWAKVIPPTTQAAQLEYAYAIKKGQPEWLEEINTFVRTIKVDGRLLRYAEKHSLAPIVLIDDAHN